MAVKRICKEVFSGLAVLLFSAALLGCFSPWEGGEGTLSIDFPGGRERASVNPATDNLEHIITLTGSGGSFSKSINGTGSAVFNLSPGEWTINVRAVGDRPSGYKVNVFPDSRILRALGQESVVIKAGASSKVAVKMIPAIEVSNWQQLQNAVEQASDGIEEIIVLGKDIVVSSGSVSVGAKKLTFIAENDVKLTSSSLGNIFNVNEGGILRLGSSLGMSGTITLEGKSGKSNEPMVRVFSAPGILEVYEGVIITGYDGNNEAKENDNSPVLITGSGIFNMYGGRFSNNKSGNGGAVYVKDGTFNMHGGSISSVNTSGNGGAVYVGTDSVFNMSGGIISGNEAANGGGVYLQGTLNINSPAQAGEVGNIRGNTKTNVDGNGKIFVNRVLYSGKW